MCSEVPRQVRKPLAGLLLLAALTLTAGCGKKGPPLPPLRFVPATVKDLVVSQQGNRVLLNFAYPKVTAAGQALGTVTEVDVYETTRPVPGAAAPPVLTPAAPGAAGTKVPATPAKPPATSATPPATPATPPATTPAPATTPPTATAPATSAPAVPATPATTPATPATPTTPAAPAPDEPQPLPGREYTSSAKVRLKLKGKEVGAATQGDRIVVELPYPEKTEAHYFTVKTLGPHGDPSGYSNQVVIVPRPAPAPPADTKITARVDGIEIAWTEPVAAPATPGTPGTPGSTGTPGAPGTPGLMGPPTPPPTPSTPPKIIGYNIYRRYSQTKGFGPALHAAAVTDRSYVDTSAQYGQSYIYTVTAVVHRDPVIESAIKTEGEIKYIDRFPPPVPREPVALVEPGRVRIVWRGSEAIDLAGYKVYRLDTKKAKPEKAEYELLTATPITEVEYTDSTVKVGGTYAYRITAIDQLGNESEPAEVRATAQ